jgi:autotransporter-associated beta strand protein
MLAAAGQQAALQEFPAGIRLAATARGEAAITALGARLPEVAAYYRKSPEKLRALFRSDHTLKADREGRLYYACDSHCEHEVEAAAEAEVSTLSIGPTDPAPFPTQEAFLLNSRPGANRVIYLDFDGHVDNTPGNWKDGAFAPPFDLDGDPATFSDTERNRIISIWQRVAEDYSIFNINVTTQDPGLAALTKANSSDQTYGIRVCIGGRSGGTGDWYTSNVGGVAYVGSFDAANDVPCWVFPENYSNNEKSIAEAASHEVGHTLGLNHDGTSTVEYYRGQGNWAPIMGISTGKQITQWSKGEYTDANNLEDDLAVMLTQGAVYRPDDHGNSTAAATVLSDPSFSPVVSGVIERNTDLDFFRVETTGGTLVINASRPPLDSNLRMELKLYNSAGTLLQTTTSADTSAGTQPVTLTRSVVGGTYFFSVDGIGNGDPLTTGYTDYASLGQYFVTVGGLIPTWRQSAANTYPWSTLANWTSTSVPGGPGVLAGINNNITGAQTINLSATTTLGSLFIGDSDGSHAFNIANGGGGSLVFNNLPAAANLGKTRGANDVISAPVSLSGELVVNQSSSGNLTFSGPVGGTGPLTKTGGGTLAISVANNFTAGLRLAAGTVTLSNSTAAGSGTILLGDTSGSDNATLQLTATGTNIANPMTVVAGSSGTKTLAGIGTNTIAYSGGITANDNLTIGNSKSAGGWTVSGASNNIAGGKTVGFSNTGSVNTTDSAPWSGQGRISYTASSSGGFLVSGAKTYSGGATLATMSGTGSIQISTSSTGLPNAPTGGPFGTGTLNIGAANLRSATSADITVGNTILFSGSPVFPTAASEKSLIFTGDAALGGNRTFTVETGSTVPGKLVEFQGAISGTSAGVTKAGAGTLRFSGTNTYNGNTTISSGILEIAGTGSLGGGFYAGAVSIASGAGLRFSSSAGQTFSGSISGAGTLTTDTGTGSLTLTAINASFTGPIAINSGTLQIGGAGRLGGGTYAGSISIASGASLQYSSSATQTLSGAITGPGSLVKDTGTGALTLGNANAYGGGTFINAGIISVTNAAALGNGPVTFNGGARLSVAAGLDVTNAIAIGANSGVIGRGLVETTGTGTATLSGPITIDNTATGGGHFAAPAANTVLHVKGPVTSAVAVSSRIGTVVFSGGGAGYTALNNGQGTTGVGADNGIATSATVTIGASAAGILDLNGFNQSLAGILQGSSTATIGNSSTTADSTLTITGSSNYAGTIVDSIAGGTRKMNLTVNGGALTLSGVNSYSGATTVSNGTLLVNGSLAAGSEVAVNGGTLGGTGTVAGNVTVSSNGNLAPGASTGTLTIGGGLDLSAMAGGTGALAFELATPAASDRIVVAGNVDIGSGLLGLGDFNFIPLAGLSAGHYPLITAAAIVGPLDAEDLTATIGDFDAALEIQDGTLHLILSAKVLAGYSGWQAANNTAGLFDEDHDNDGVPNGIEYFLGGMADTTGFTLLPGVTNNGGTLSITWTMGGDYAGDYGTNFQVETSETLSGPWNVEKADPEAGFTVTFPTEKEVKFTFPPGTTNFARLKVTP